MLRYVSIGYSCSCCPSRKGSPYLSWLLFRSWSIDAQVATEMQRKVRWTMAKSKARESPGWFSEVTGNSHIVCPLVALAVGRQSLLAYVGFRTCCYMRERRTEVPGLFHSRTVQSQEWMFVICPRVTRLDSLAHFVRSIKMLFWTVLENCQNSLPRPHTRLPMPPWWAVTFDTNTTKEATHQKKSRRIAYFRNPSTKFRSVTDSKYVLSTLSSPRRLVPREL